MLLVEQTTVPGAVLPVAQLKDHMLLGTGFADDGAQDLLVENYLRAAIAAIEARTGKVLVAKSYSWTLTVWREACRQPLPLAPVSTLDAVRLVDRLDQSSVVDPANYRLMVDDHRPAIVGASGNLPSIAMGGTVEIDLTAGYGPAWDDVPVDLAQAAFLLATHYYENRNVAGQDVGIPMGVTVLIERYRSLRILGGSAR